MVTFQRIDMVLALAAVVIVTDTTSALAQRGGFNFGGGSNNNNNSNNNQGGNRRNRDRDNDNDDNQSDVEQIQQFFGGGQGSQGNQNNSGIQQFRRNNQQSGQGGGQLKNSQQLQQFIQGGRSGQGKSWQTQKFNRRNDLQNWVVGFNGGPRPFSSDWYSNHPQAWKHHHHHNNDAWQIATTAGVIGWLGWQANRPYNNTVIVYDTVPVETVIVDGQPQVVIDPATGEWMTLGAYTLLTGAGDPGTRILQLSVDKQGNIRGSYYDMITNDTHHVIGLIDQRTQQVRWTLDTNRQLTFVATLDQLTDSQGIVNVKLPGGQVQQWQLVRMENAAASN